MTFVTEATGTLGAGSVVTDADVLHSYRRIGFFVSTGT